MNSAFSDIVGRRSCASFAALIFSFVFIQPVLASWTVTPIRIELSSQSRTETIIIGNDGNASVQFDIEPRLWLQDDSGQDFYETTDDLVVFPRVLSIPSKESRIIRVGLKVPAGPIEKTYRVFIREKQKEQPSDTGKVSILVNFGVPIFSLPAKPLPSGQIASLGMGDGVLKATVQNTGNVHLQFRSITLRGVDDAGGELFTQTLGAGYLLSGSRRDFPLPFPAEACPQLRRVTATFHSDTLDLEQSTGADAALCPQ